jgi:hypothetical protein
MKNIAAPAGTEGQVVESILRYKLYMVAMLREPTQAEVDALMVQTNAFYLGTFMGSYDNVVDFQADGKQVRRSALMLCLFWFNSHDTDFNRAGIPV